MSATIILSTIPYNIHTNNDLSISTFDSALMEKDLTLALGAANTIKARLPLGAQAHQLYGLLCEQGYGDKDFGVVYKYLMTTHKEKEK